MQGRIESGGKICGEKEWIPNSQCYTSWKSWTREPGGLLIKLTKSGFKWHILWCFKKETVYCYGGLSRNILPNSIWFPSFLCWWIIFDKHQFYTKDDFHSSTTNNTSFNHHLHNSTFLSLLAPVHYALCCWFYSHTWFKFLWGRGFGFLYFICLTSSKLVLLLYFYFAVSYKIFRSIFRVSSSEISTNNLFQHFMLLILKCFGTFKTYRRIPGRNYTI